MRDELVAEVTGAWRSRSPARGRGARPRRVAPGGPVDASRLRPGGRAAARPAPDLLNVVPTHGVWGRRPRPSSPASCSRGRWSPGHAARRRRRAVPAGGAAGGTPDNVAPAFHGGFVISGRDGRTEGDFYAVGPRSTRASRPWCSSADPGLDRGRPWVTARRRTPRGRRRGRRTDRAARRRPRPASQSTCCAAPRLPPLQDYRRPGHAGLARPRRRAPPDWRPGRGVRRRADRAAFTDDASAAAPGALPRRLDRPPPDRRPRGCSS